MLFEALSLATPLTAILIWIAAVDIKEYRIPNLAIILLAVLAGIEIWWVRSDTLYWRIAAAASAAALFISINYLHYLLRGKMGLGTGDAKLFAIGGLWTGFSGLPMILLIASASGLVCTLLLRRSKSPVPFGPYLALGIWIVWLSEKVIGATTTY